MKNSLFILIYLLFAGCSAYIDNIGLDAEENDNGYYNKSISATIKFK